MATITATASLQSEFTIVPITGFLDVKIGTIDPQTGYVVAENTTTWGDYADFTWGTLPSWKISYAPIRWAAPLLDIGSVKYFTLDIEAQFTGTINYLIYTSTTGEFAGEETETYVSEGDTVPLFYARYVRVVALVTGKEFRNLNITTNTSTVSLQLTDVDTTTLSGTTDNKQLDLDAINLSGIIELDIIPRSVNSFTLDVYVTDYPNSTVVVPTVINKTQGRFALYGLDNFPRDGIIDARIVGLPSMVMNNGQIVSNR